MCYNNRVKEARAAVPPEGKLYPHPFPQRTGGRCKPVKRQEVPLSKLSVKAERVSPLSLLKRFGGNPPFNPGGNAGDILVPVLCRGDFLFPFQRVRKGIGGQAPRVFPPTPSVF